MSRPDYSAFFWMQLCVLGAVREPWEDPGYDMGYCLDRYLLDDPV